MTGSREHGRGHDRLSEQRSSSEDKCDLGRPLSYRGLRCTSQANTQTVTITRQSAWEARTLSPAANAPTWANALTHWHWPDQRKSPPYNYPFDGSDRNAFADEQILLTELAPFEQRPRPVTLVRLIELFGPILRAASFDERDPDDAWLRTALSLDDDYVAVTRGQIYVGMLSRSAVLARIVSALASQSARS